MTKEERKEMQEKFANGEYAYVYVIDYKNQKICEREGEVIKYRNGIRAIFKQDGELLRLGEEGEIREGRVIWFSYPNRDGAIDLFKKREYQRFEAISKDTGRKLKILESL